MFGEAGVGVLMKKTGRGDKRVEGICGSKNNWGRRGKTCGVSSCGVIGAGGRGEKER